VDTPQNLTGRITTLFDNGRLEQAAACPFDGASHMLLCGNPTMIEDMTTLLKARGFEKHRRKKAGHFNFEKYW
jgi:ferredoxin--NADP+ reductase